MRTAARFLVAFIASLSVFAAAGAPAEDAADKGLAVSVEDLDLALFDTSQARFGKLDWRGGLRLESEDPRFGGFSGLAVSSDGGRMLAVSDHGWWLKGTLKRRDGHLAGFTDAGMASILASDGRRARSHTRRDAEGLAVWDARGLQGRLMVAFEQRARIELFDVGRAGFAARPRLLELPKAIAEGPNNQELEAIGRFIEGPRQGFILALSEANLDESGNIRGWMWNGERSESFRFRRHSDYLITDVAILPGGEALVTLERGFSLFLPPGMAIRRFRAAELEAGATLDGEVLFEARRPLHAVDNMEAIAAHRSADGRTVLTVLSDDNYIRSIQSTILIEFALDP